MRGYKINCQFTFGMAVLFTVIITAPAPAVAIGPIDTFDVRVDGVVDGVTVNGTQTPEQRLFTSGVDLPSSEAFSWYKTPGGDTSVLGGYRDVFVQQFAGALSTDVSINQQRLGGGRNPELSFSSASGVESIVTLSYDGGDMSSDINPNGLGGADLTHGGQSNGLVVTFPEVDKPMNLLITVWQQDEGGQKASQYFNEIETVDNGDPALEKFVAFSDFVISEKAGVSDAVMDFSNIGAVAFEYNAPGLGGSPTAALDFRANSVQKGARIVPEPASAVSFLIGCLGLCYFEAFRLRRKRREMR